MSKEQFSIILWLHVERIVNLLMIELQIDCQTALRYLIKSRMYQLLENETTKLWHFSSLFLFKVVKKEIETHTFSFPDEVM